jgi:hypothetical protein
MGDIRRGLALALALAVCAGPARAGKGIQDISVRRLSNLTSVAVQAIVSGDDDSSAVLRIFQKWQGAASFDTGMVMVRRVGTRIREGRILWMKPGRTVQFYVQGRDASGDFTTPVLLTHTNPIRWRNARRRADLLRQPVRRQRRVRRHPRAWSGYGTGGPTRTIGAALAASRRRPTRARAAALWIAPGEYHEHLVPPISPTTARRASWPATARTASSTILCGANPWAEKGLWGPDGPAGVDPARDSIWVTGTRTCGPVEPRRLGPARGARLGRVPAPEDLVQGHAPGFTWAGVPESSNVGERSGWLWQHDSLFVKRANGKSPVGVTLHAGYLDELIDVRRRNWRISDLTLRFAGGTSGDPGHPANPDPGLRGTGITTGINGTGSGLVVVNCRFYGLNSTAIYAGHSYDGFRADSITVAGCTFDGLTVGSMAYGAGKSRAEEDVGQIRLLSSDAIVVDNVFTGGFNGLELGCGDAVLGARDSTMGSGCEVTHNTFTHLADDAIELRTRATASTRWCWATRSWTPATASAGAHLTGPVFAFYNTLSGGIPSPAGSSWAATDRHRLVRPQHGHPRIQRLGDRRLIGRRRDNIHFRNNVLAAQGKYWGYTIWGMRPTRATTNDFNYDLIDSVTTHRLVSWGSQEYSLPQLQTRFHWEMNGLRASPLFSDSAKQNWALTPLSPAHGRGQRMTGINTSLDGPLYLGAPDIGAISLPAVADAPPGGVLPPRFLARASPNPAHGDGAIVYALPADAVVTVRLYDPSGRVAATLLDGVRQPAGEHRLALGDARLRPGLYFYRVTAGEQLAQGRIVILE